MKKLLFLSKLSWNFNDVIIVKTKLVRKLNFLNTFLHELTRPA